MERVEFSAEVHPFQHAVAASFDLSGFSSFCKGPNAHAFLARYIHAVFAEFDLVFDQGIGNFILGGRRQLNQVSRPDYVKYTGDGALLLWVHDSGSGFTSEFCTSLVLSLREFQCRLPDLVSEWQRSWRVEGLPSCARVGVATGPVQPLFGVDRLLVEGPVDYAGYCINLAVRLQDHCRLVPFLVHAPVEPQCTGLVSLLARKIKGSMDESVYAFWDDLEPAYRTNPRELQRCFAGLQSALSNASPPE